MKKQRFTTELVGFAKDAFAHAGESLDHGRAAMGDSLGRGAQALADAGEGSSVLRAGARRAGQLAGLVGAYTSLKSLGQAFETIPLDTVLARLGLQRRRSVLTTVVRGAGMVAAGMAVGAGVALLLAPQSGARTRDGLDRRLRTLRRETLTAARDALHRVEDRARAATGRAQPPAATGTEPPTSPAGAVPADATLGSPS